MSILSTVVVAFSMSADAFAAAIGKGVVLKRPRLTAAARIGLIFGGIETIAPIIGWLIGTGASEYVEAFDHWIAFGLLAVIGLKMLVDSLKKDTSCVPARPGIGGLVLTACGTSVDAMAVGATMALLDMNIFLLACAIGSATFVMATLGVMAGHYIGEKGGKWAEALGGLGLIAVGTAILIDHIG